jgi:hypothetical protein
MQISLKYNQLAVDRTALNTATLFVMIFKVTLKVEPWLAGIFQDYLACPAFLLKSDSGTLEKLSYIYKL